jgi:hypothetical protein
MQCGPVRYKVDAKMQAATRMFAHRVRLRETGFRLPPQLESNAPLQIPALYAALAADDKRNDLIFDDVLTSLEVGRRPVILIHGMSPIGKCAILDISLWQYRTIAHVATLCGRKIKVPPLRNPGANLCVTSWCVRLMKPAASNRTMISAPMAEPQRSRHLSYNWGNGLAMPKIHSLPHWPAIITTID